MPQEHIVSAYDEELAILDKLIAEMGGRVERLLVDAVKSLTTYDVDLAKSVIEADQKIDDLEIDIDEQATKLLALRQPMASDLRKIIATLRIANDLERMGDYAKNIAKRTVTITQMPMMSSMGRSIDRMSRMVGEMIRKVLDAYIDGDAKIAQDVIVSDEEVDQMHTSLFREILTYMMEDPRNITTCTHFLFIAKNVERIGDHTTNIAEQVYYIVEGNKLEDEHQNLDRASTILARAKKDDS